MWISHRKEIRKLTFRALALRRSESKSLRRWANARNVSFRISLRWLIHIINLVDKTQLLRSSKNAFIMQSKSTFLEFLNGNSSLQIWPPRKILPGQILQLQMTSLQSTMCFACLMFPFTCRGGLFVCGRDRAQKPPDMRTSALATVSCIPAVRFSKWRRTNHNLTRHSGRCQTAVLALMIFQHRWTESVSIQPCLGDAIEKIGLKQVL